MPTDWHGVFPIQEEVQENMKCYGVMSGFHLRQCSRNGTVSRDGKSYCRQHDPVEVKRKNAEREAKWKEEWKKGEERENTRELREQAGLFDLTDGDLKLVIELGGFKFLIEKAKS